VWEQDPKAVRSVLAELRQLAATPRPPHAARLSDNLYRLHAGDYRVLYEVKDTEITVLVIHIGRRSQR
jgi:mRNA interferase RelE/StbE